MRSKGYPGKSKSPRIRTAAGRKLAAAYANGPGLSKRDALKAQAQAVMIDEMEREEIRRKLKPTAKRLRKVLLEAVQALDWVEKQ